MDLRVEYQGSIVIRRLVLHACDCYEIVNVFEKDGYKEYHQVLRKVYI
jgi:hypothetical protein